MATFCTNLKKTSEQFIEQNSTISSTITLRCQWQDCTINLDATISVLEHIQTVHVAPQISVMDGYYICLWEGCKVYNKRSCSLSWLERHVLLTHGGNKPFKCIIPGCGLSFGSQVALQRHVNSHMTKSGSNGAGVAITNRRLDSSLSASARRKKLLRQRKQQRQITRPPVDYFDKHTMEVIKYRLATSRDLVGGGDQHGCFFRSEILHRRCSVNEEEPHVFVRWHPLNVLPDEWVPLSKHVESKLVPFRQLPRNKIKALHPNLFPPERKEKAQRKWKKPCLDNICP